jgi:hypothetical protein
MHEQKADTATPPRTWSLPLVALSYVLSAASMLNLIQDLSPITLYGKLKSWADAYALLLHTVGDFLFSWIHVAWLGISRAEHHVIAVGSLLGVAAYRATLRLHREWGFDFTMAHSYSWPVFFIYFVLAFVPCLVLPDYWGCVLAALCVIAYSSKVFTHRHSPWGPISSRASGQAVLRELAGVLALLALVLVVNYAVFRPNGT